MAYSSQTHEVHERQSGRIRFTLKDELGAAVPSAVFTTATLTLYNVNTRALINPLGRPADQNVLNANNVTVHATSGEWTWDMQPTDNAILDEAQVLERHVALFEFAWGSGKQFRHEVILNVKNLAHVP